ncbi:MAG: hypothetical protein ACT4OI_04775, partial [Methanobacteriota archaeon]
MSQRVTELPACKKCGGRFVPLSLCDTCGGASVLRDVRTVDATFACPDCGSENATQLLCLQCHDRRPLASLDASAPAAKRRPTSCPSCATFLGPNDTKCPTCGMTFGVSKARERVKARRTRRIRGDLDAIQIQEFQRVLGASPEQARALVGAGYRALWRIGRAQESDLASVPGIGPEAAKAIFQRFRAIPLDQRPRAKPPAHADEEFECPLCGCVTSSFALSCRDCRAAFDDEEMDEEVRRTLLRDGDQGLLAFYDLRLMDDAEDADLWYARGVLLDGMGRPQDALQSFERAAAAAPSKRKIAIARSRVLAKLTNEPTAAEQLRSTLREVVDTAALEQELAEFQKSMVAEPSECRSCGEPVTGGAKACPSCGMSISGVPLPPDELDIPEAPEDEEIASLDSLLGELRPSPVREEPEPVTEEPPVEASAEPAPDIDEASPTEPPSPPLTASAQETPHVSGARGFRTRSLFRFRRKTLEAGRTNGAVNGRGLVNGVGRTNGMVNGRGRTNGLVNGMGRTNGMVNGRGRTNGLVNGSGRVNGVGRISSRLPRASKRTTLGFLVAGVVMAGIIATALYFPVPTSTGPITIDGVLDDWASVPSLDAATPVADPNVRLARYASVLDGDDLYLFAATQGMTFGDSVGYDAVFFLVDADGDPATGFRFSDVGAEFVIETYGANGTLVASRGYAFPADAEVNWSRRTPGPNVWAAGSSRGVELRVSAFDLGLFDLDAFRVSVVADNFEGAQSRSEALLSRQPGAVHVDVSSLTSVVGAGPTELAEIRVRALGGIADSDQWTVSSFRLNATPGLVTSLSAESVNLTRGQPTATVRVSVQAPGFFTGEAVEVELQGAAGPRPITIVGGPVRGYVGATNATKRIDGLFADWSTDTVTDTDPVRVDNADVDIVRHGAATDGTQAFFYAEVGGSAFRGSIPQRIVPIVEGPPGGGSSGTTTLEPRRTGEDILRVYVDVNATDSSGTYFEGILADYLIEIRGHGARITSKVLYAWTTEWRVAAGPVSAAKDARALEGGATLPVTPDLQMVFASTDWSYSRDLTAALRASIGALPVVVAGPSPQAAPGLVIHSGTNALLVLARALANEPTIDGSCGTTSTEYQGSDAATSANLRFHVGRRSTIWYVFVCIEVAADTSNDGASDWGELLFDQGHEGSSTPQDNDRRFRVTSGAGGTFSQDKGDGSAWTSCGGSCDAGNSARGEFNNSVNEVYEFRIRFSDIWGTDSPTD